MATGVAVKGDMAVVRTIPTRFALLFAIGCMAGSSAIGQTPSQAAPQTSQLPTFRSEVRFIEVDAVVRDDDGNFVTNLTKNDFEILEDGQPQEVSTLSVVNLPIDRSGKPIETADGGSTTAAADPLGDVGRIYVLMLDSGLVENVRSIARQFIDDYLGPTDLMAVVHKTNRAATQGLTRDKELLRASVDRYTGGGFGVASYQAIQEVAVNLNSVSGRRKAILFIGTGADLWSPDREQRNTEARQQMWRGHFDAIQTAARNNVRIYPIDPGGFLSPHEVVNFAAGEKNGLPHSGKFPDDRPDEEKARGAARLAAIAAVPDKAEKLDSLSRLRMRPGLPDPDEQSLLRLIAEDTGGIAIVNTNNFGGNFGRVVRDNSSYYVLGYYSPAERDGRFHRITVRVKNRPELSVRGSRAGYSAATPDVKGRSVKMPKGLSANARDALRTATPVSGLPIEIFTTVFQGDGYDGAILIGTHVPGEALKLAPNDRIELSYVAVDRWGTVRAAERRAFTLTLGNEMRDRVTKTGLRLFGRLKVPRGRYEIRVVAHQPGGATGSSVAEVEIPDYRDQSLSISELVVSSSRGRSLTTLEEDPVLRRALPTQPTPNRRFGRDEALTVFGEVYDSHWMLSQEIGVTAVITTEDGRLVSRQERALASANRGRFYYTSQIPLGGFDAGAYTLSVEAYTRVGVPASVSQQLRFEVVDRP